MPPAVVVLDAEVLGGRLVVVVDTLLVVEAGRDVV